LVGYPIVKLEGGERDLHWFLRALEEVILRALASYGIAAERRDGMTGVWAQGKKLASIGIAVRKWVSFHGFALNVNTDLARFSAIAPCGLDARVMGSMASLGVPAAPDEVAARVARSFADVLGRAFSDAPPNLLQ
jgi:lipoyl(octanoyl) transferase